VVGLGSNNRGSCFEKKRGIILRYHCRRLRHIKTGPNRSMTAWTTHGDTASAFFSKRYSSSMTSAHIGIYTPTWTKIRISNTKSEFQSVARVGNRSKREWAR
jgi:hypothetical protein